MAKLDEKTGKLQLKVNGEEKTFSLPKVTTYTLDDVTELSIAVQEIQLEKLYELRTKFGENARDEDFEQLIQMKLMVDNEFKSVAGETISKVYGGQFTEDDIVRGTDMNELYTILGYVQNAAFTGKDAQAEKVRQISKAKSER